MSGQKINPTDNLESDYDQPERWLNDDFEQKVGIPPRRQPVDGSIQPTKKDKK